MKAILRAALVVAAVCWAGAAGAARAADDPSFDGTVQAYRSSMVNAKVIANVAETPVEEGQPVEEGEVLARLDDAVPRAQYELALLQSSDTTALRAAELQLEQARRDLATEKGLGDTSTPVNLQKARYSCDVAEVTVANRRNELEQLAATARLRKAQLEEYLVRAPFKGVVAEKFTNVGESTYPTDRRLFEVIDTSKVYIKVAPAIEYASQLKVGRKATVTSNACPGRRLEGTIAYIAPSAVVGGSHFIVKVLVDNSEGLLLPESTVTVTLAGLDARPAPPSAGEGG